MSPDTVKLAKAATVWTAAYCTSTVVVTALKNLLPARNLYQKVVFSIGLIMISSFVNDAAKAKASSMWEDAKARLTEFKEENSR